MSETRLFRPARILMFGAPGAGKGTYASRVGKTWRIPHIATGDMIRDEINSGSNLGSKFKDYVNKGMLVPDSMVNELAKHRLSQLDVVSNGYILDGYPRTLEQAQILSSCAPPHLCINITLPDKYLIRKISGRRIKVCKKCKCNYNVATIQDGLYDMPPLLPKNPKICDSCQEKLELFQREDDTPEVVKERLEVYRNSTAPLIEFYTQQGILFSFEVYKGVADLPSLMELILMKLEVRQLNATKDANCT